MKGSLSDSWRLWVLFGMGRRLAIHHNITSKQVPGQAKRLAPMIVVFDYSSLILFFSFFFAGRIKESASQLGVKRVSKIMRAIPNGVPVAQWMKAHTMYSQHYGLTSQIGIKTSPRPRCFIEDVSSELQLWSRLSLSLEKTGTESSEWTSHSRRGSTTLSPIFFPPLKNCNFQNFLRIFFFFCKVWTQNWIMTMFYCRV